MAEANDIIHQPLRLRIMAALNPLPRSEAIDFTRLKAITQATDGNLGAHLTTLEKAGYVAIEKDFVRKRPRTRVAMTSTGRKAFAAHVAYLREILEQGTTTGVASAPPAGPAYGGKAQRLPPSR